MIKVILMYEIIMHNTKKMFSLKNWKSSFSGKDCKDEKLKYMLIVNVEKMFSH
jgi:hypothetical protein